MRHAVGRTLNNLLVALVLLSAVAVAGARVEPDRPALYHQLNTESFPTVRLQLFGIDGQGMPIDFATEPLFVSHDGFPVDEVAFDGKTPVGTLTVFLIDAAGGTTDQIPAIKAAIRQFAAPGNMQEQLDYVGRLSDSRQRPATTPGPTQFYNGVNNFWTPPS